MTLDEIREIARIEADREEGYRHRINVCVAAGCLSCQSASVKEALENGGFSLPADIQEIKLYGGQTSIPVTLRTEET